MRRLRNVKIVATLGPASSDYKTIRALFEAGADVFRLNMSHGTHDDQKARYDIIRRVEADCDRPIAVLADLQGPKLRVGTFAAHAAELDEGQKFRFDLDPAPGDGHRVCLPHKEIFAALEPGATLLVNDGKIRMRVDACGPDFADCTVTTGGTISDRKGVNVPDVVLPLAALSAKDKKELTEEEKEYKSKRKLVQEKLIKFATRIPAFMYLTDFRENTLQDVITKLEPDLFHAVTGLTVADFHLLVRLKVFNTERMNEAVFAFRRYEDASLRYTGIESHRGLTHYGLYDTVVAKD